MGDSCLVNGHSWGCHHESPEVLGTYCPTLCRCLIICRMLTDDLMFLTPSLLGLCFKDIEPFLLVTSLCRCESAVEKHGL